MDDIVLPPLPPMPLFDPEKTWVWLDQIRNEAVIADRKRRAEAEPEKVHQATVYLGVDGLARLIDGGYPTVARCVVRWTDDGRVWIESADHRRSAIELRRAALWLRSEDAHVFAAACARAANLLDGGEPC